MIKYETGIGLIAAERQRQIIEEQWDEDHDDTHDKSEMAIVAALYAVDGLKKIKVIGRVHKSNGGGMDCDYCGTDVWPDSWDEQWDKRGIGTRIRRLSKAGALIAAEIDRLIRRKAP